MAGANESIETLARQRGFRMTVQRQIILDAVQSLQGHITAEAVYAHIRDRYPQVNLSTVYRTLEFLEKLDLVRHTHFDDGVARWHGADETPHQHLICRRCGQEQELDLAVLAPLGAALKHAYRFRADLAHFALVGVCGDCDATPDRHSLAADAPPP